MPSFKVSIEDTDSQYVTQTPIMNSSVLLGLLKMHCTLKNNSHLTFPCF